MAVASAGSTYSGPRGVKPGSGPVGYGTRLGRAVAVWFMPNDMSCN
jgi:hypothetical protein